MYFNNIVTIQSNETKSVVEQLKCANQHMTSVIHETQRQQHVLCSPAPSTGRPQSSQQQLQVKGAQQPTFRHPADSGLPSSFLPSFPPLIVCPSDQPSSLTVGLSCCFNYICCSCSFVCDKVLAALLLTPVRLQCRFGGGVIIPVVIIGTHPHMSASCGTGRQKDELEAVACALVSPACTALLPAAERN